MPGSTCVSSAGRSLSLQFSLLLLLLLLPPLVLLADPGVLSPGRQPLSYAHVDPESCAVDLVHLSLLPSRRPHFPFLLAVLGVRC